MSKSHGFDLELVYDGEDVRVTGSITPGCEAVMHLSNGDPGYPAEPAEIEDFKAYRDGVEITDDAELERMFIALEDDIFEAAADDSGPEDDY